MKICILHTLTPEITLEYSSVLDVANDSRLKECMQNISDGLQYSFEPPSERKANKVMKTIKNGTMDPKTLCELWNEHIETWYCCGIGRKQLWIMTIEE